jgi:hypothetical protein
MRMAISVALRQGCGACSRARATGAGRGQRAQLRACLRSAGGERALQPDVAEDFDVNMFVLRCNEC